MAGRLALTKLFVNAFLLGPFQQHSAALPVYGFICDKMVTNRQVLASNNGYILIMFLRYMRGMYYIGIERRQLWER